MHANIYLLKLFINYIKRDRFDSEKQEGSMVSRKIRLSLATITASVFLAGVPVFADQPTNPGNSNPQEKVTICHATKSQSNPYVKESVNANGSVSGHAGNSHQDGEDIIPPFDYNDDDTVKHFDGQNWDTQGQAIFNNDCKAGGQGGDEPGGQVTTNAQTPGAGQAVAAGQGQAAPQAVAPQGGVTAGAGGAKVTSAGAIAGLVASIGTVASGLVLAARKF